MNQLISSVAFESLFCFNCLLFNKINRPSGNVQMRIDLRLATNIATTTIPKAPQPRVVSVSMNDEGTLFAVCMESGTRVYNTDPLVGKLFLDTNTIGSVSLCGLLHRTNFIGIVGGGNRPKYADNTVLIWDDSLKKFVLEYTFHSPVLALKMRRDCIFVAEQNRIHCFGFPNSSKKIFTVPTRDNPQGLFQVTPATHVTELQVLVYPGHTLGTIQLLDLSRAVPFQHSAEGADVSMSETNSATSSVSPITINAHQTEIACLSLNRTGTLLATASKKGTLIRIFRTITKENTTSMGVVGSGGSGSSSNNSSGTAGQTNTYIPLSPVKIAEFRRGMDAAMLYCIVFSADSEYVMASSDKGTVHIFALKETRLNRRSTFSSVPFMNVGVTYTDSQWALAKFTVPAECACMCTFGSDRFTVFAICVDGTFHKYRFNLDGQCVRDNFDNYIDIPEETDHILL